MENKNMEEIIFTIIANAGNTKGLIYEAIDIAKDGDIDEAKKKLEESDEFLNKAHQIQTEIITNEVNGDHMDVTMLFVHAQDHISSAIELRTLAEVIIDLYARIKAVKGEEE